MQIKDLKQTEQFQWLIPKSFRSDMRVPVRVFANHEIIEQVVQDQSLEQAVNASALPGLVGEVVVMPDVHQGYGFPIGGVAATRFPDGVISPGAIGYDINCGVRLMTSQITLEEAKPWLEDLAYFLDQLCPSGVGVGGNIQLSARDLESVCLEGSHWTERKGYADHTAIRRTEATGCLPGANPGKVSKRALERGVSQLGTLGSGNHFIEVDVVERIFDHKSAESMGLEEGFLVVQIHCGSRGFGHQICTDYVRKFQDAIHKYGIVIPDRSLVCVPLDSPDGQDYLSAMNCAANYAFANRQVLAHFAAKAFETVLAGKVSNWHLQQVYDLAHNIGKIETHQIGGREEKVCVHRKGATRAFGPGLNELPVEYREIGQPVLVPGSMGTASWVLTGREESMNLSFGSSCHGAGRLLSRKQAKKTVRGTELLQELNRRGIKIQAGSMPGLAEEAPLAYKDVDTVVEIVVGAKIARKTARLKPVIVVKG